ncbi:unnamed protein product, partial [Scytosiphon promiscuus]
MRDAASPGGRRASSGRLVFPEYHQSNRSRGRGSIGRTALLDHDDDPQLQATPHHRRSSHRNKGLRTSSFLAESIMRYVQTEDEAGLEQFLSELSPSERELAYGAEVAAGGPGSPVLVAVRSGNAAIVLSVLKWLPEDQAGTLLMAKDDDNGQTVLMLAASVGDVDVFEMVASKLPHPQILAHLTETCVHGNLVFAYAVKTGRATVIEAVIALFPYDEAADALCSKNFLGETTLMQAAGAPYPGAFQVVSKVLTENELAKQLSLKTEQGQTALTIATRAGNVSTWKAVASMMPAKTISTLLGARNKQGQTPAQVAVACGADGVLTAMMRPEWIPACVLDAPDESEAQLTALDLAARPPAKLGVIRCLLACGATPSARVATQTQRRNACSKEGIKMIHSPYFKKDLVQLKRDVNALVLLVLRHLPDTVEGFDRFSAAAATTKTSVVATSTEHKAEPKPRQAAVKLRFVPDLPAFSHEAPWSGSGDGKRPVSPVRQSLSSTIARGVAAVGGPIGTSDGRGASDGKNVSASGTGTSLVQQMLEPELAGLQPRHRAGPLAQAREGTCPYRAMQSRHVDFIYTPLVVDYLRLKFSAGLPNPFRETNWRREHGRMDGDLGRFMLDDDESKLMVYILQGGCADSPSWTYFPGLQFILAGVVGKTSAFFGVPAMRLALDVLVYVGVVSVFVLKMLVLKDAGRLSPWDVLWMVYLVGAIWKQVQEAGSVRGHLTNPWNVVEATSLASLSAAFFFRMWAYTCNGHGEFFCGEVLSASVNELNEVYLAQYFQAASAPFVLGKVLFLTQQIHSSLGPLMHSTFHVMGDLARFGALMLIITLGFALAFYAMFGSAAAHLPEGGGIAEYDTYYSSILTLFASMLGNFDFETFDGAPMAEAGMVLLAFFLCVMNVTLLNLLIAILATAHARVEGNADKEAVLSEAIIITQYRRAMRLDSLPSPLNVPQELISYVFWRHRERAKELVARGVFWLVSGPIAIAATAVLWAVSLPLTLTWAGRVVRSSGSMMLIPALLGISFNLGVAPLATAWLWLRGIAGIWHEGHETMETSDRNEIEVSRAYRRRTFAGAPVSPLAGVASAAVAANIATTAGGSGNQQGKQGVTSPGSTPASKRWKRAAGVGGGGGGGTDVRHRGFDVVAAIKALHGVSMQEMKEAMDERIREAGEPYQHQLGKQFAEALAGIAEGHRRLEAMVRKADLNTARVQKKLDQVLEAL